MKLVIEVVGKKLATELLKKIEEGMSLEEACRVALDAHPQKKAITLTEHQEAGTYDPHSAIKIISHGRETGLSWKAIADRLNAQNLVTSRGTVYDMVRARILYRSYRTGKLEHHRPTERPKRYV
ncbi:hypothetical protein NMD10_27845 (plasmid) [Citrobacter portucalensis]|uniref:hypothetical protein n=1 Tax=Citrobacter portucalensis TaxID=1639133 RepID=UPI00351D3830